MKILISLIMIITSVSLAVTATQTDWSGGSGVPGPVTDWGDSYDIGDQINHTGNTLSLMSEILAVPVEHTVDDDFFGAQSVYSADVDGDGDMDVLGAALSAGEIAWWENTDGTGTSWTEHIIDSDFSGAILVNSADVDGDGDMDVLGAAWLAYEIAWWENTNGIGTSWTKHTVDGAFDNARSVYSADVDGDGDIDVLGAAYFTDGIIWWENTDGTGTSWIDHVVDGSFVGANSVFATDIDGDADVDVLGASSSRGDIIWWENTDGTGTSWTEHVVDDSFSGLKSVFASDVDGDGDTDILGAGATGTNERDITWWENTDSTGTSWIEHTVDGVFEGAYSVYATDVDGDGDTDVLGAAGGDGIIWWENTDGTGTSLTKHIVNGDFVGARSVFAADIDGDGNMDVIGAALTVDEVAWWDVMGFSPVGTLESSILNAGTVDSWENFTSSEMEPAGTSVSYQFRSSNNSADMGAWSDTVFTSTGLSDILVDFTDYLQYRVILQSTDPQITPVLNDISFTYTTYVGVADDNTGEVVFWGLTLCENPSLGNFAVQVSVPQPVMVDLVLHDITGRVVTTYSQELPSGVHTVSFNNLAEGVYFCTVHAGDFTATERIIVLIQ